MNYFYPDSIQKEDISLSIVFTSLKIKNKEVKPGINSPLKKQINFAKEIILEHSFETFTIEFTSLHFSSTHKHKYKFMLEGYNKEWVETDANYKTATYTNLNPGDYVFKVITSNIENSNNELSAEIKIKVLSPFWKTWWFYSLEIILAVLLVFGLIKAKEKKLKNDNKKLEKIVAERTIKIKQQHNEILTQNEEIIQHNEEVRLQNVRLNEYKNLLENMVKKRTEKLKKALNKATESERLKTAFLENLSHEIRTPLNAIVGFSQLLEIPGFTVEDQLNYVRKIQFGSDSLLKIVDSIMYVSKIQVGEYKLNKTEFPLNELLQEHYISTKNAILAKKNKDIEVKLNTNQLNKQVIYTDRSCISLVLTNMIDNAIKFTEKGSIEIAVSKKTKGMIQFMVKDTGIGIPEKDIEFVFEKFQKGKNHKSKLFRGLGVGLAISKSIIDLLGGNIWFESELNKGSVFYCSIPFEKPSDEHYSKSSMQQ